MARTGAPLSRTQRVTSFFVAATRAMRSLLVITPKGDDSMLFDGFDPTLWHAG